MKPIAMRCTEQQWLDIKPILKKNNIKLGKEAFTNILSQVSNFEYLVTNYNDDLGLVNLTFSDNKKNYNRTVYEEWDKNIFLEACDIKIEEEFVLPKEWYVKATLDNKDVLRKWRDGSYSEWNANLVMLSCKLWDNIYSSNITRGRFKEITYEQFCKYVLKQEIKINMNNRFPFMLLSHHAQKIIDIACSSWKSKLAAAWGPNIVIGKNTEISEQHYKEMRGACTTDQHKLFDDIFGKDIPECPYKVDDWITIDNVVVKINKILEDHYHYYWIKHTPNASTGGGFSYKSYKDRIRLATDKEILEATTSYNYKDGELVWVKNSSNIWELRYTKGIIYDGKLECYDAQTRNAGTSFWRIYKPAPGIVLPD